MHLIRVWLTALLLFLVHLRHSPSTALFTSTPFQVLGSVLVLVGYSCYYLSDFRSLQASPVGPLYARVPHFDMTLLTLSLPPSHAHSPPYQQPCPSRHTTMSVLPPTLRTAGIVSASASSPHSYPYRVGRQPGTTPTTTILHHRPRQCHGSYMVSADLLHVRYSTIVY